MPVGLKPPAELHPVAGVELATISAGLRRRPADDLLLVRCAPGTRYSAVFTRNAFCAAPVTVCRRLLGAGEPIGGFLVNAGNANAGTGAAGIATAEACARRGGELVADGAALLPFSTGVIGQALPREKLLEAMERAGAGLDAGNWSAAARAIMTTDTLPKGASRRVHTAAGEFSVTGIAKGAGMICPDMATMLAFVACDAPLDQAQLDATLRAAVSESFNSITVDGDTSTNDAVLLCATGDPAQTLGADGLDAVSAAITELMVELAQAIVRDAEGATKFVTVEVGGARDAEEARRVAQTIAHSPLVKTAWFASDANWGRILAAVGRAGIADLAIEKVDLHLDGVCLIRGGEPDPGYREEHGAAVMSQPEFTVRVNLGRGQSAQRIWTCDLGHDYVRINAEYRT